MERIGVRELRQHASRYLARVAGGESIEITDRGKPVALLVPTANDPWEELRASGQVIEATEVGTVFEESPWDFGIAASERLAAQRENER